MRRLLIALAALLVLLSAPMGGDAKGHRHRPAVEDTTKRHHKPGVGRAVKRPSGKPRWSQGKPAWLKQRKGKGPGAPAPAGVVYASPPIGTIRIDYYGTPGYINHAYVTYQLDLNTVTWDMPRAPSFVLAQRQNTPCTQLPWPPPARTYIVCTVPSIPGQYDATGRWVDPKATTWSDPIHQRAFVTIENSPAVWGIIQEVMCHEAIHATTNAFDGPFIYPDTSCMRGYLAHPGAWDIANMRWWWG